MCAPTQALGSTGQGAPPGLPPKAAALPLSSGGRTAGGQGDPPLARRAWACTPELLVLVRWPRGAGGRKVVVLPHPGGRRGHGIPLIEGLASFPPPRTDPGGWAGHLTTDGGLLGGCPAGTSSSWSGGWHRYAPGYTKRDAQDGSGSCPVLKWQSKACPQTLSCSVGLGAESPKSGCPSLVLLRVQRVGKSHLTSEMRFHEPHGLPGTRVAPPDHQPPRTPHMFLSHRVKISTSQARSTLATAHAERGLASQTSASSPRHTHPPNGQREGCRGGQDVSNRNSPPVAGGRPAAQPLEKTRLADMPKLETREYHVTRRAHPGHLPRGHETLLPEGRRQGGPTSSVHSDPKLGTSPVSVHQQQNEEIYGGPVVQQIP